MTRTNQVFGSHYTWRYTRKREEANLMKIQIKSDINAFELELL